MNTIVTEMTEQGEVAIDIFQKLSNDRILFICGTIDDKISADICATLLLRDSEDKNSKITIFINSDGGNIRDVLAIYDVMRIISAPVETVCIGAAMNESAVILAAGTPGMRLATKHSVICVGQLTNNMISYSDVTDAGILQKQVSENNKQMMTALAKSTKKTVKQVMSDLDRKVYLNANQAMKYGLVDGVINNKK